MTLFTAPVHWTRAAAPAPLTAHGVPPGAPAVPRVPLGQEGAGFDLGGYKGEVDVPGSWAPLKPLKQGRPDASLDPNPRTRSGSRSTTHVDPVDRWMQRLGGSADMVNSRCTGSVSGSLRFTISQTRRMGIHADQARGRHRFQSHRAVGCGPGTDQLKYDNSHHSLCSSYFRKCCRML